MVLYGKEWQIPIFSEEEIKGRWKKIRELMFSRGIECLVIGGTTGNHKAWYGDIRYVSNWINWFDDEYCVFPLQGEPSLHVWTGGHGEWTKKVSVIQEIIPGSRAGIWPQYVPDIVKKIKSLGLDKATIGIVTLRRFPAFVYLGLVKNLPDATFVEAGEILAACRVVKSPAELEYVRKAGECADKGFVAMANAAKVGVNKYKLAAECERAMVEAGAELGSFNLFNPKQWPDGSGLPHGGDNRPLQKGDIIFNEITPCFGGYFGHLCRPISLGKPPADFTEILAIFKEMYRIGRENFRAGNILTEVDAKVSKYALSKRPFSHATAMFQNMTEMVTWPNHPHRGELKVGMAFAIHPSTAAPESERKQNKGHSGHIVGDVCIVTEGEAESVSKLPMEVTVV